MNCCKKAARLLSKPLSIALSVLLLLQLASCVWEGGDFGSADGSAGTKEGSGAGENSGAASDEPPKEDSKAGAEWMEELARRENPYKGRKFTVLAAHGAAELFSSENTAGGKTPHDGKTPLARAVALRNDLIKQRLGIEIVCTTTDNVEKEVRRAAEKGKPCADLICAPESVLAKLAADGLLENLRSLPYIDFDAPYADKASVKEQTAMNTLYLFSGDLTLSAKSCIGLFYNKALVRGCGTDPEALARAGDLTWSELSAMVQYVVEKDAHGITSLLPERGLPFCRLACAVYGSAGGKIVSAGVGTQAHSAYDAEAAAYAANIVQELFKNPQYAVQYDEKTAAAALKSGKLGFVLATLDKVSLFDITEKDSAGKTPAELKNMEWGLLPLPKRDALQSCYRSVVSPDAMALAVPRGNGDSGFSGFVLNVLLASSTDSLSEALKVTYRNFHFWSNSEALMLELIAHTRQFDLGLCYSAVDAVANIGRTPLGKGKGGDLSDEAKAEFDSFAARTFR